MEGERGRGREGVTFPCVYIFSVIGKYRAVFYFPPDEVLTGARGVVNHFHGVLSVFNKSHPNLLLQFLEIYIVVFL